MKIKISALACVSICLVVFCAIFALPKNSLSKPISASYFGMHIHRAENKPWPDIPFGTWRLWDAHVAWPDLESERGKWNFSLLDKHVQKAKEHNVNILLTLGLTPQWASSRPNEPSGYKLGNAAEPRNISDWQNYVRTVATRYKDKIKEYEVWNEPNLKMFYTGKSKDLLFLAQEAYKIIKEIDSNAIIVSPAATGNDGISWLDKYLHLGGDKYCDVIGYHLYITSDPPEKLPEFINSVKKTIAKHDVNKPLWNTESGWWIGDGSKKPEWVNPNWLRVLPEKSSSFISRALILAAFSGVERYYWYAWDNADTGLVDNKTERAHKGGDAFRALNDWFIGRSIDSCIRQNNGIWVCIISEKSIKIGEIIWSDAAPLTISRSQKPDYTVVEQLDGAERFLAQDDVISITDTPVFLKVKGTANQPRILRKNDESSSQTAPLFIRDTPVRIKNVPIILKP